MDTHKILSDLRAERNRLDQAIAALEALDGVTRPQTRAKRAAAPVTPARRGRRHMSAAARKRMSEMMKQRWAERKKKQKTA